MQQSSSEDWFLTGLKKHLDSPEFKEGQPLRDELRAITKDFDDKRRKMVEQDCSKENAGKIDGGTGLEYGSKVAKKSAPKK